MSPQELPGAVTLTNRRTFLHTTAALASLRTLAPNKKPAHRAAFFVAGGEHRRYRPPTGVLTLLEKHISKSEITPWPIDARNGIEEMLLQSFPNLGITKHETEAFTNDFLLHDSGPYHNAHRDFKA